MSANPTTSSIAAARPHVHPSRRTAVYGSKRSSTQKRKREDDDDASTRSDQRPPPGKRRSLSSKVRSLGRLLNHATELRPDVRREKEREFAAKKAELEEAQIKKERGIMVGRYHMVRFFERKRATRVLKKAKRELEASKTESSDVERIRLLERNVHDAEVDLNYTQYAPLMEKYKGLYPKDERTAKEQMKDRGDEGFRIEEETHPKGAASSLDAFASVQNERPSASARYNTTWRLIENAMQSEEKGVLERIRESRPTESRARASQVQVSKSKRVSEAKPESSKESKTREQKKKKKGGTVKEAKIESIPDKTPVVAAPRHVSERKGNQGIQEMVYEADSGSEGGFFEE